MNISKIDTHFASHSSITDGEVELFRLLAKSICKYSKSVFIDETHGKVANVKYQSVKKKQKPCEISDLLIVIYCPRDNAFRATFWQAKKETNSKWNLHKGVSDFDFKGQFNQWELLAYRPLIEGVGKFKPHAKVLSDANSPSIGSFGVFYEKSGRVEVNYSVAEMVTAHTLACHPKMSINYRLENYTYWENEVIVTKSLLEFLSSIESFQIGSLINVQNDSDNWLFNYIKEKCKNSPSPITQQIFDYNTTQNVPQNPDGTSLLFVALENN